MLKRFFQRFMPRDDREIFRYWDGVNQRSIDPMKSLRILYTHPEFSFDKDPALVEAGDQDALERSLKAIRDAFGVSEYSEQGNRVSGLTQDETFDLLMNFMEYVTALKKNSVPNLTLPESTGPQCSEPSPTNAVSDSGSI